MSVSDGSWERWLVRHCDKQENYLSKLNKKKRKGNLKDRSCANFLCIVVARRAGFSAKWNVFIRCHSDTTRQVGSWALKIRTDCGVFIACYISMEYVLQCMWLQSGQPMHEGRHYTSQVWMCWCFNGVKNVQFIIYLFIYLFIYCYCR